MFKIDEYCPPGVHLLDPWMHGGLIPCFSETVFSAICAGVILLFGITQLIFYRRFGNPVEPQFLRNTCGGRLQMALLICVPLVATIRFILQATYLYTHTVYGYMLLTLITSLLAWPMSFILLQQECSLILPSIPSRGHGLILLTFWTLSFLSELLVLISFSNDSYWWRLKNTSDILELLMWITRLCLTMSIFGLGIKGPGLPNHDLAYDNIAEQGGNEHDNNNRQSTWAGVLYKVKKLGPFIWPKGRYLLQLRVLGCICILILERFTNLITPIYYKNIVDSLTPLPGNNASLTVSQHLMSIRPVPLLLREASVEDVVREVTERLFRWDYILIYVGLRILHGFGAGGFGLLMTLRLQLWIRVRQYTTREMDLKLLSKLHSISLNWHLSRKTGEVLKIVERGTNSTTGIFEYVLFNIIPSIADFIIGIVYFASRFNLWFALIVFLTMVFYLVCTLMITEWRTKYCRQRIKLDNDKNARAVDSLINFETVKYCGSESFEVNRYREDIVAYQNADWKYLTTLNLLHIVQNVIITSGFLVGTLLCAHYTVAGYFTVGHFVLFCVYIVQLFFPLNKLGTNYREMQQNFIDMENMFKLMDEKQEIQDTVDAKPFEILGGEVEFKHVKFHYDKAKPILKGISFRVPPGETYALVGHSGSGKSTVIRLIFRLYDLHSGEISIDGQDIKQVTQQTLRQSIGVVSQDTVLFNSEILYNIRYGRVEASDEEVHKAAKAADIHDRIVNFPDGYASVVGERGLKLSGGEKQRIAIARTLLKAPKIVLLDEATSALDTKTERNIQASLNKVCENRTTLVVAHRLSTIVNANQILVMHEGEIVERGKHEELMAIRDGHYATMWNQQSKGEGEEEVGEKLVDV